MGKFTLLWERHIQRLRVSCILEALVFKAPKNILQETSLAPSWDAKTYEKHKQQDQKGAAGDGKVKRNGGEDLKIHRA
ncbi:hypothetical protein SMCB_2211 [Serpentinimonas maccroryi]|uniref:Uncharacterized protein n=1 Tax=Serpentinimonas maccroryi TaxID=1458426 RepID=A0A060NZY5_9BURK|nr:hypothetical protein SMCB_2211 [Serpentinimonas maccroryi]